jgi:DHA2 family multidrug resistance protein
LIGKGFDARWLIGAGLLIVAAGSFWMSRMNLDIAPGQVVWPRVVLIIGLSLIFAPINVAAFLYIPRELRGAAVGLFALLRNEGGSFGASFGKIVTERREQLHSLRLNENLDPLNSALTTFTDQSQARFLQQFGDPVAAKQMALQALDNLRSHQALALSYFDAFLLFAVAAVALSFIVPFMRRSVVAKGAHVSAE